MRQIKEMVSVLSLLKCIMNALTTLYHPFLCIEIIIKALKFKFR